jgi:hypothetical protein
VSLLSRANLAPVAPPIDAPKADALAVSADWLAYRAPRPDGGDAIFARQITNPAAPGTELTVDSVPGPGRLSGPSIDESTLVYAVAAHGTTKIVEHALGTDHYRAVLRSGRLLLFSPSIKANAIAYTRTDARSSQLLIRKLHAHGAGRRLLGVKRRKGMIWTSALTEDAAYAAVLGPGGKGSEIIKVSRSHPRRFHHHRPRGGGNHKF